MSNNFKRELRLFVQLFVLLILLVLPLAYLVYMGYYDSEQVYVSQYWLDDRREIVSIKDKEVLQTFQAREGNLSGFDIAFPYEGNSKENVLNLEVLNISGEILRSYIIRDSAILGTTRPLKVRFDPIVDSKDMEFIMKMSPIGNKEKELSVLVSAYDTYESGELSIDGRKQKGDMSFVPVYREGNINEFNNILLSRLTINKIFPLNKSISWIILIITFYLTVSFLFFLLLKSKLDNAKALK